MQFYSDFQKTVYQRHQLTKNILFHNIINVIKKALECAIFCILFVCDLSELINKRPNMVDSTLETRITNSHFLTN